jgi:AcrR family transcriptional regulator
MVDTPETDVRTRILVEAVRLFAERGYAGTSLQSIADAAGITKPTLVYHYGNKDGLRGARSSSLSWGTGSRSSRA